jgi:hypothetical protein
MLLCNAPSLYALHDAAASSGTPGWRWPGAALYYLAPGAVIRYWHPEARVSGRGTYNPRG